MHLLPPIDSFQDHGLFYDALLSTQLNPFPMPIQFPISFTFTAALVYVWV